MPADTLPKLIRTAPGPFHPGDEAYLREVSQREGWTALSHRDLRELLGEIDRLRAALGTPATAAPRATPTLEDLLS